MRFNSLFLSICIGLAGVVDAQTDFDVVKQRVVATIMDAPVNDTTIARLIKTINKDGSLPGINYADVSNTGFEHSTHLAKMVEMGRAFNNKDSKYYKSKKLNELVNRSLKFWCDNDFICDNWWYNQIFTPLSLVTVLLVMDDNIDPEIKEKAMPIIGRAHLDAPGARQGGDRIKIGGIAAKKVMFVGDQVQFEQIMKVINDEIKFTTGDRGMQHDYSFHHRVDRVNTTYSYGKGYADAFAEWAAYVAGTKYAFSEEKLRQLIDYYLDGICKQFVYGIYTDKGAFNRGVSRKETFGPHSTVTPKKLLMATDYRKMELEEIVGLREGKIKPTASFSKFFWQSEYFVFQRPHFYTSVRMFSVRNRNMEKPYNSEGLLNHHRGDGTNFLSVRGDEYLNIWPVYDWQKIPGTTVLQKPNLPSEEEIQKDGVTDFVGAVTDGLYGAVAFDFISPHDFIKARKSWFFFDDEYVCLGAGIESGASGLSVVTTLDQTLLRGDVIVADSQKVTTLAVGEHELSNVSWVLHNNVGYRFPGPTSIQLSNKQDSGTWYDINKQWKSPKGMIKKDVFKLWIDHGARPQGRRGGLRNESMIAKDVKYQYIVIPSADAKSMADDRSIEIIANNRLVQAAKHRELGICQIIFYQAGELAISDKLTVSIESPGAVMIKMDGEVIKGISVSDPSRKLSRLHMKISGKIVAGRGDKFKSTFDSVKKLSELIIDLPSGFYAGQSVVLEL